MPFLPAPRGLALAGPALLALLGSAAPAAAVARAGPDAPCPPGTGVTVVVDFGPLGGGTRVGCAAEAPGSGTDAVTAAGFDLTGVVTQPGFVCRVEGRPGPRAEQCRRTPPEDAYWGLFVADRAGAPWTYATVGVGSLEPAVGSYLGFRFQDGSGRVPPGREELAGTGGTDELKTTAGTAAEDQRDGSDGAGTALVPVAAALVAGLLAATYLVARRRRSG